MVTKSTMPLPIETARFDALRKLAAERFGPITPSEEQVLRLSSSIQNPASSESKDRPEVRAEFLRWIVTDNEAARVGKQRLRAGHGNTAGTA